MIYLSVGPEYIAKIGNFYITNTLFCSLISSLLLIIIAIFVRIKIRDLPKEKSLQNFFELLLEKSLKFITSAVRSETLAYQVFPLILTFFIFIVFENLLGLLPGFLGAFFVKKESLKIPLLKSPNSDLNSTLALAIVSVGSIQYFGIKILGIKDYLKRFFNFTNPIKLIIGFFELFSEITKILSLSLRLFGNILAGEVLLLVCGFFLPYFLPLPFIFLEIFVGVIQAFIFATLSLVFIKTALREI
jgi:F-type H+-transporting ATPase subunit a